MTQEKQTSTTQDFDWALLESQSARKKRVPNKHILEKYNDIIFNHENYALDMYESMFVNNTIENKEVSIEEVKTIIDIVTIKADEMHVILTGMIDCIIDLNAEKTFITATGFTSTEQFVEWLGTENGKKDFLNNKFTLVIDQVKPYITGSIAKGYSQKLRSEYAEQIKNPTKAYFGKILEKNGGGFIIDVQGVLGFLPGSLAAANIVRDFNSMIGKTIPVVVEDFLKDSNTFVFSYKKYVAMVLPSKLENLDHTTIYEGVITGIAKFGIFIEFEEFFTGLLHSSKMTAECKEKFANQEFKPGSAISFWIKEITADNKIILTDENPQVRDLEIEDFKEKNLGTIRGGEVVSIQPFGTLVKFQKDICGMISQKELKTKKKTFTVGETVMVSIDRVQNNKIFLSLPEEA